MQNLITRERAQQSLQGVSSFTNEEIRVLDHCLAAVSEAIRQFCRRHFVAQHYDELYDGTGHQELLLRQYPTLAVEKVATDPTCVLRVRNTDTSTNQRATVQITTDGLKLVRVASGVTTVDETVTFASNVTLGAVVTAIDALGNGWDAAVENSDYENWPSADLRPIQGALACRGAFADLKLHVTELSGYEVDENRGLLIWGDDILLTNWHGDCPSGWGRGRNNFRVVYTAGYESVPEPIQEACAEWAAMLFWQTKRDPGARQQSIPGVIFQTYVLHGGEIPGQLLPLLRPYRRNILGGI